jgi:5-methylcytosine-specific restriction enzyme A
MRREFSKPVKRDALKRADKKCEGCGALFGLKFHFDHDIADGLGGEPTLENCKVLCHPCHDEKTRKHDVPLIAKVKRISDKHNGIYAPKQKIASRGFQKRPPQRTASRPVERRT